MLRQGARFLRFRDLAAQGKGERQAFPKIEGIRADHRGRYKFACEFVNNGDVILDCASGVGYGSFIVSQSTEASEILALDNNRMALKYAKRYYSHPRIRHECADIFSFELPEEYFDVIMSFETIEHVDGQMLLRCFRRSLKKGGRLICSTPNQERLPFDQTNFPFHKRHYTSEEFKDLLEMNYFCLLGEYSQHDMDREIVSKGWGGLYNIAVVQKNR